MEENQKENSIVKKVEELQGIVLKLNKYVKGRRNIHAPVREGVNELSLLIGKLAEAVAMPAAEFIAPPALVTATTSNTEWQIACSKNVRRKAPRGSQPTDNQTTPVQLTPVQTMPTTVPTLVISEDEPAETALVPPNPRQSIKKGKKRLQRRGPNIITVVCPGTAEPTPITTYASVVRRITEAAKTRCPLADVHSIKRTYKGNLVIRLGKSGEGADELQAIATEVAGPNATIRRETPGRIVMIRDLDEGATKEDVVAAMQTFLGEEKPERIEVVNLRPAHSGTQVCVVKIPHTCKSDALLTEGRIKIGLIRCRLRERIETLRCYRCMAFGHTATKCTGPDRTKICRQCGLAGHQIADCKNAPRCFLCAQKSNKNAAAVAHVSGSSRCPAFKTELVRSKKL